MDACFHSVLMRFPFPLTREMISARSAGVLDQSAYAKMVRSSSSKLCALPVCAASWLLSRRGLATQPAIHAASARKMTAEFLGLVAEGRREDADMPHAAERTALMNTILEEMEEMVRRTVDDLLSQS